MHTPAWQALRLAALRHNPLVCRFIAGRRFPTSKRSFQSVPQRNRQDEPPEPSELPEAVQNHIVEQYLPPQSSEGQEVEAEEVAESFGGTPPHPSNSKDPSPYGSASRRAFRNVKRPPATPPALPSWFLEGNVTLKEENGVNPADLYRGGSLEQLNRNLKTRIYNARVEEEGKTSPGAADSAWKSEKDALYSIDASVYQEIRDMISAGLNIPRDPDNSSSSRPHLILHCPQEGGTYFLDFLVKHFALLSETDIVRIDAQDIAEIGGRYIKDFKDMHGNTLSVLGYQTYMVPPSREVQENDDAAEDEGEDLEEEDDRRRPKSMSFPISKPSMSILPVQVSGGKLADFLGMLGGEGGRPMMPSKFSGQLITPQSQNAETNREAKTSLFIEALLSATEAKRKAQPIIMGSGVAAADGEPIKEDIQDSSSFDSNADSLASSTTETAEGKSTIFQEAPNINSSSNPLQKIIIHIRDYHEIISTQNGSRMLERLHETVQRKRGEGQRIIIIGTTTAEELLPSLSKSGLRHVQSDQSNRFTRTIVTPSIAPSADTQFAEESKTRIEDINIRHIRDMLRRISSDPFQTNALLSEATLELDSHLVFSSGLDESVWSMDKVHRVATLALGRLQENEEMKVDDIEGALSLIDMSDTSKVTFLEKEAALEKQRSNPLHRDPASTASNDERMKKLRKSCNTHEKKLLHGVINPSAIRTTFTDVRAPPETIEALKTLTSLSLVRPDAFTYGVLATDRIPGLLLYGPPGTGKTLLAKAVAKESGATVLEVSGSDVYDMYVGEGEKNIRAIFTLAKKLTPCIVFIDEADAILGSRGGSSNRTTHRELINQFLREWDGMTATSAFIMVATNRPFDLDEASLRRLPRRLLVDLPTEKDREAILGIHLKDEQLAEDVSLSNLASQTPFYSGSDLKNVAVAAALACVREEFDAAAAAAKSASTTTPSSETTSSSDPSTQSSPSPDIPLSTTESPSTATLSPPVSPSTLSSSTPSSTDSPSSSPETYPKRTLHAHHFTRALEEISASISEDMGSLSAIRKFDEKYGDRRGRRKKLGGYGFETVKEGEREAGGEKGRVRRETQV
ncbi:hypothetical protein G7Y79_00007g022820 [Physcia stellaris]|nr:hypothetical protein G7Y79_00007g022820 [Physcia stellaris]